MSTSTLDSEQREGVIRVSSEEARTVAVCLEGEFDLANAPALDVEIDRALDSGHDLIMDLSDATFVDSSVIHVFVRAAQAARGRKQTMVLQLGTAAIVERALELSGIERVLPRAHDRQEAVRMIQQVAESV